MESGDFAERETIESLKPIVFLWESRNIQKSKTWRQLKECVVSKNSLHAFLDLNMGDLHLYQSNEIVIQCV